MRLTLLASDLTGLGFPGVGPQTLILVVQVRIPVPQGVTLPIAGNIAVRPGDRQAGVCNIETERGSYAGSARFVSHRPAATNHAP